MTTELVNVINGQAVTTSVKVAEVFGKSHGEVLRAIRKVLRDLKNLKIEKSVVKSMFLKVRDLYFINRDGFCLLTSNFKSKKALDWKIKYVEDFAKVEKFLQELDAENEADGEVEETYITREEYLALYRFLKERGIVPLAERDGFLDPEK